MKNIGYLMLIMLSCQSNDNAIEAPQAWPTIFQGKVLYADNSEPVSNAILRIFILKIFLLEVVYQLKLWIVHLMITPKESSI
jgi:hypothetical protein